VKATARALIGLALREDLGRRGDLTTRLFLPPEARLSGRVVAKEEGVVCGTRIAREVFRACDRGCRVRILAADGRRVRKGQAVMKVSGGREILTAERTALNFLQHLSGIATLTAAYVRRVRGLRPRIYDTRKTLPGWRELEKYAVRCGGGRNHRMGLYDAVLLKDNHWDWAGEVRAKVGSLRRRHPVTVEIEAAGLAQVRRALEAGPDIILLDNMTREELRRAIGLIRREAPKIKIEISGGVTLENVRALATLGPDRISVGRLTHSAPAANLSLEIP